MRVSFDPGDRDKITKWMMEFHPNCGSEAGAIGGAFTYCISPNGLGSIEKVNCFCGKNELDLTDYENW